MQDHSLLKRATSECMGTALLVFLATAAIDSHALHFSNFEIAATFGVAVMVSIVIFGDISGSHINPAVTLGFWMGKHIDTKSALVYVPAQLIGGSIGAIAFASLVPDFQGGVVTKVHESITVFQALGIEVAISSILMFSILGIGDRPTVEKGQVAMVVGATVFLLALVIGPLTGASMNPARSFGPAVAAGNWQDFWIYVIGPAAGCALSCWLWKFFKSADSA